jgi:hypothetical protein
LHGFTQAVRQGLSGGTIGAFELGHTAFAAGSDEIKIALVGCGGRGTGAAFDALGNHTHSNIRLVAMADAFAEPIKRAHQDLQNQFHDKVDVPPSRRFVGLDAFEKAIAAGPASFSSARLRDSAPRSSLRRSRRESMGSWKNQSPWMHPAIAP